MIGDDEDSGFAEICAVLCERFGTAFELQHIGGNCVTIVAQLVGVYRSELGTNGEHIDLPDRFAYAYSETAPPTAEAIGDLVQEALENATIQFLHEAKGGRRHA